MRITGHHSVPYPVELVWGALLDPAVLVRTIPGCERLEATGEHTYAMTVSAGVAAIRGTYDGTCGLSDLVPHESLVMRLQGAGAPGTIDATVRVSFTEADGLTTVAYDADATVGGMVGGVGQRMLASVSKRTAGEFFDNVAGAIDTPAVPASAAAGVAGAADGRRRARPAHHRPAPPRVVPAGLPARDRRRRRAGAARRPRRLPPRPAAAVTVGIPGSPGILALVGGCNTREAPGVPPACDRWGA